MFDIFNKKKNEEMLNSQLAGQMLQNIFDVCEVEANSVPLEVLESYSNYRKDRFLLQRIILIIILVVFFALPLLFVGPQMSTKDVTKELSSPVYKVTVSSLLPVKSVTASIDGKHVPVYETANNVYSVEPAEGGQMIINATAYNNQYSTKTINVSTIDREPPNAVSDTTKDDIIYIYLKDDKSGVNYKKIYALDVNENKILPLSYDAKEGYVAFNYPDSSLNLYIPDKADNVLRLILTVK